MSLTQVMFSFCWEKWNKVMRLECLGVVITFRFCRPKLHWVCQIRWIPAENLLQNWNFPKHCPGPRQSLQPEIRVSVFLPFLFVLLPIQSLLSLLLHDFLLSWRKKPRCAVRRKLGRKKKQKKNTTKTTEGARMKDLYLERWWSGERNQLWRGRCSRPRDHVLSVPFTHQPLHTHTPPLSFPLSLCRRLHTFLIDGVFVGATEIKTKARKNEWK